MIRILIIIEFQEPNPNGDPLLYVSPRNGVRTTSLSHSHTRYTEMRRALLQAHEDFVRSALAEKQVALPNLAFQTWGGFTEEVGSLERSQCELWEGRNADPRATRTTLIHYY